MNEYDLLRYLNIILPVDELVTKCDLPNMTIYDGIID